MAGNGRPYGAQVDPGPQFFLLEVVVWIRFWYKVNCSSGPTSVEVDYAWYVPRPSDEVLKDTAEENVPSWCRESERGYQYGYEDVETLPVQDKAMLVSRFKRQKDYAEEMLRVLGQ